MRGYPDENYTNAKIGSGTGHGAVDAADCVLLCVYLAGYHTGLLSGTIR